MNKSSIAFMFTALMSAAKGASATLNASVCDSVDIFPDANGTLPNLQAITLPAQHMPNNFELSVTNFTALCESHAQFKTAIQEYLNSSDTECSNLIDSETVSDAIDIISIGTCDVQSKYLCQMHLANPRLTLQQLASMLQNKLPQLVEHYASIAYLQAQPKSELIIEKLDEQFYSPEFIAASEKTGYEDEPYITLRYHLNAQDELEKQLLKIVQIIEAFCEANPGIGFLTDIGVNVLGFGRVPDHVVALLHQGKDYIFYDSDIATMYKGPLGAILPQVFFNFTKQIMQALRNEANAPQKTDNNLLQDLCKRTIVEIYFENVMKNPNQMKIPADPLPHQISIVQNTLAAVRHAMGEAATNTCKPRLNN